MVIQIKYTRCIFYGSTFFSIILLLCFLFSLYHLFLETNTGQSLLIENKFSLSLLLVLAIIPTLWVSIIIKGLFLQKHIETKEEKESNFPIKEIFEIINKNTSL